MLLRPIQRIVFKFIRISVDGEIIENDTKTIVWTENILSVFKFIRISVDGAFCQRSKGANRPLQLVRFVAPFQTT